MRNRVRCELGIFKTEWRARRGLLACLGGLMALLGAFIWGRGDLSTGAFPVLPVIASACLGVLLFTREEADPARSFIYQLPISRRRLLGLKLAALASQLAALVGLTLVLAAAPVFTQWISYTFYYNSNFHYDLLKGFGAGAQALAVAVALSLTVASVAAIAGLHARSPIVALALTLLIAAGIVGVTSLTLLTGIVTINDRAVGRLPARLDSLPVGWIILRQGITAALLVGWLFFLFCRTRLLELGSTARLLLALLFGVAAIEVLFMMFFTGWRDLAFWAFGF